MEEIVIYENDKLKYHLVVKNNSGDRKEPSTIDELNRIYYFMIFEYDENGYEIKQTKYNTNESNELVIGIIYYVENLLIDENKNWTKRIIYHYWNSEKIIAQEIDRIIKYK